MKGLSIRQPWATLIARGIKTLEVRSRRTLYRGPLLIVASRSGEISPDGRDAAHRMKINADRLPRGIALAIVTLIGCRRMIPEDAERACCAFEPGAYVWVMFGARPVRPVRVLGKLGIFDIDFESRLESVK